MYQEDVEKIFHQEVRDKKRTGRGIYNRASRKGYVGTVRTTVDYLKGKEKKEYIKGSEVKVSNVYDNIENIPAYEDFQTMEYERAKQILSYIRERHSCTKVAKQWKRSSTSSVYALYYKFGVVEKGSGPLKPRKKRRINLDSEEKIEASVVNQPEVIIEPKIQEIDIVKDFNKIMDGFYLSLSGTYSKEFVENKIINILQTLDLDKRYNVTLELRELD